MFVCMYICDKEGYKNSCGKVPVNLNFHSLLFILMVCFQVPLLCIFLLILYCRRVSVFKSIACFI